MTSERSANSVAGTSTSSPPWRCHQLRISDRANPAQTAFTKPFEPDAEIGVPGLSVRLPFRRMAHMTKNQTASLKPMAKITEKPMHQGIAPSDKLRKAAKRFSPTARARRQPACGPIVMGATNPRPTRPNLSQARHIHFCGSRTRGMRNFLAIQSRAGVPRRSITPAPAAYPHQATKAATGTLRPAAMPPGIAPTK